jgi:hypothetical protein
MGPLFEFVGVHGTENLISLAKSFQKPSGIALHLDVTAA